jgi:hypothetical protein
MKYAAFPKKCTDDDILDMLLTDAMVAICPFCGSVIESEVSDEVLCKNCLETSGSPFYNPEELTLDV